MTIAEWMQHPLTNGLTGAACMFLGYSLRMLVEAIQRRRK